VRAGVKDGREGRADIVRDCNSEIWANDSAWQANFPQGIRWKVGGDVDELCVRPPPVLNYVFVLYEYLVVTEPNRILENSGRGLCFREAGYATFEHAHSFQGFSRVGLVQTVTSDGTRVSRATSEQPATLNPSLSRAVTIQGLDLVLWMGDSGIP
jgi:hypothetical protein